MPGVCLGRMFKLRFGRYITCFGILYPKRPQLSFENNLYFALPISRSTFFFVDKTMEGILGSFISSICFNIRVFAFLLPLCSVPGVELTYQTFLKPGLQNCNFFWPKKMNSSLFLSHLWAKKSWIFFNRILFQKQPGGSITNHGRVSWKQRPLRPPKTPKLENKDPPYFSELRNYDQPVVNATESWALATRISRLLLASWTDIIRRIFFVLNWKILCFVSSKELTPCLFEVFNFHRK